MFVSRKNVFRFFQSDNIYILKNEPKRICEITYMLMLRMQGALRANTGSDYNLWRVTFIRNMGQPVKVIDKLVYCLQ